MRMSAMTAQPAALNERRRLLEKMFAESYTTYIQRCCAQYALDHGPVISTYAKLVFGGADPPHAAQSALWVHGVYDEDEDMKVPGRKRERIFCEVEEFEKHGDGRKPTMCVMVTCTKCGHQTESYGTHERSVRRCMALMAQECPNYESNYYHTEREDDGENYL
jgi:hypothetical protein